MKTFHLTGQPVKSTSCKVCVRVCVCVCLFPKNFAFLNSVKRSLFQVGLAFSLRRPSGRFSPVVAMSVCLLFSVSSMQIFFSGIKIAQFVDFWARLSRK